MSKKVYIEESNLVKLRNAMTGKNTSHSTFMSEDKPPYEKDNYEICGEGGNNDYFHVNENAYQELINIAIKFRPNKFKKWAVIIPSKPGIMPNYFEKKSRAIEFKKWYGEGVIVDLDKYNNLNESYGFSRNVDLSEIGRVNYTWDFDEDYYLEWLEDNEYADNEYIKLQYVKEGNVEFELDFCDNQTYHTIGTDSVYYDDLEDLFGERMAETILKNCIEDGSGYFDTEELYDDDNFDINSPSELDDMAMKVLRHGEYYKDCRGFILSNGVVVYTGMEHNEVTRIPGINDKFQFIKLGNIRLLDHSIDIGKEPTKQQYDVLKQVLRCYDGEELYLDIFYKGSETGVHYPVCNPNYVLGEITRLYSEGIKPQGGSFYEEKKIGSKNILTESQESKSIAAAKKLVMQRLGYNEQEADEFVRIKLRNDIPSLRTPQGGKFILGVTRMFCDGELRNANDIRNLNSTLKFVASDAHINEYDRNINGLSAQELIQRFAKAMSDNLEAEKDEINQMVFDAPSDYEIVRINSFEQAEEYGDYVSWCVTHDENMFDSYTSNGINQFYFCLKRGFRSVDDKPGNGCPLDEYGLSMIAVSVNENGMLNTCTCRWNHDNGGNDSIMDAKQVSQVIGINFFDVFKPNNKWKELLANIKQRLANGEEPTDVFDYVGDFSEGFTAVEFNEKYNFINQEGRLISDQWFDDVGDFSEGFAAVELNEKNNFINQEGRFLSNQWFDCANDFSEGFAAVKLNGKYNFINQKVRFLSNQWFDDAYYFREGFAWVKLNGKYNFINQEGRLISDQWFDDVNDFSEGFAAVKLNGKYYKLDTNGNLTIDESKKNKRIILPENKLISIKENLENEVEANEVSLDSFKKQKELAPKIWDGDKLNSRVRLKLLDIADDFWETTDIGWVKPKGIVLMGSICNYNWSKSSDIDLHLQVDFSEVDEKKDFVQEYFNAKKNEWNKGHSNLKIFDFPVEVYVEDIDANTNSGGIYDLEENNWIKKPSKDGIKPISLNKYSIKDKSAEIMTDIDDLYDAFKKTDDDAKLRKIGKKARHILDYVKAMRKKGLNRGGESDSFNIIYKCIRRLGYLDKLYDLESLCYDRLNSIEETLIKEDVDIFDLAKERFGITNDIRECGYILPDGSMLDFSGRHMVTGDTSHLRGRRGVDHRNIGDLQWDKELKVRTNVNINMSGFIRSGAIRIHCSNTWSSINLFKKPTKQQANVLIRLIQYSKGNVTVEIGDGDNSYEYAEWDDANPRRVINDIIRYFDGETIKLVGNVVENKIIKEYFNKYCRLNEEIVADGNASHNPFKQRWKHERETLINYLLNYGELMTSKENGKQYKVLFDEMLSNRIGFNYCLCIQWNPLTMEPGNVIYVRAYDKFTKKLFRPQFDYRGRDNLEGTLDDVV